MSFEHLLTPLFVGLYKPIFEVSAWTVKEFHTQIKVALMFLQSSTWRNRSYILSWPQKSQQSSKLNAALMTRACRIYYIIYVRDSVWISMHSQESPVWHETTTHTHTKKFRKNQNTEKLLSGVPQGLNLQQGWHAYWCPFFSTTIKRAVAVRWERRAARCSGISMYETWCGRCRTRQTRFYWRDFPLCTNKLTVHIKLTAHS